MKLSSCECLTQCSNMCSWKPPSGQFLGETISTQPLAYTSILYHLEVSFNLYYLCILTLPLLIIIWLSPYFPKRMELCVRNTPAAQASIKSESVAAHSARKPTAAMSLARDGASAAIPPMKIPSDATWANPHRA